MLIFGARRSLSLKNYQRCLLNSSSLFSQKIQHFLKKLLNNKVFSTSFVIKKSYVNFWRKPFLFPKKLSKEPPKQFLAAFSENDQFSKNR